MRYDLVGDLFWLKDEMTKKNKHFSCRILLRNISMISWVKMRKESFGRKTFTFRWFSLDFVLRFLFDWCANEQMTSIVMLMDKMKKLNDIEKKMIRCCFIFIYIRRCFHQDSIFVWGINVCSFSTIDYQIHYSIRSLSLSKNNYVNLHRIGSNRMNRRVHMNFSTIPVLFGVKRESINGWID